MDSIICPKIRYDVLPMYNCPFFEDFERNCEDTFSEDGAEVMRKEADEGYVLVLKEYYNEDEYQASETGDLLRCNAYQKIGPTARKSFTLEEAERVGSMLGINWKSSPFDAHQFRDGMDVELEHGRRDMLTNVTNDDPILTGKIALAHLNEFPDYYIRLQKMEQEAMAHFGMG